MKKISLTVCLLVLISLTACLDHTDNFTATFEIINVTDHHVLIKMYQGDIILRDEVELSQGGQSVSYQAESRWGGPPAMTTAFRADSAIMIFDDERFILHLAHLSGKPVPKNLFTRSIYQEDPEHYYTYKITEQDYEQSVPFEK